VLFVRSSAPIKILFNYCSLAFADRAGGFYGANRKPVCAADLAHIPLHALAHPCRCRRLLARQAPGHGNERHSSLARVAYTGWLPAWWSGFSKKRSARPGSPSLDCFCRGALALHALDSLPAARLAGERRRLCALVRAYFYTTTSSKVLGPHLAAHLHHFSRRAGCTSFHAKPLRKNATARVTAFLHSFAATGLLALACMV